MFVAHGILYPRILLLYVCMKIKETIWKYIHIYETICKYIYIYETIYKLVYSTSEINWTVRACFWKTRVNKRITAIVNLNLKSSNPQEADATWCVYTYYNTKILKMNMYSIQYISKKCKKKVCVYIYKWLFLKCWCFFLCNSCTCDLAANSRILVTWM